jgi:hypothetical protein
LDRSSSCPATESRAAISAWSKRDKLAAAHQAAAVPGYRITLSADTCVFRDIRMHWPTLLDEPAAAGYARPARRGERRNALKAS